LYHLPSSSRSTRPSTTLHSPSTPQVAAAASQRSRDAHVTAVAAAFDKCDKFDKNDKTKNNPSDVSDINDFFVFNRTTVADILAAKHSLYTYWGSNHWCDADGEYILILIWAISETSCFVHSPGEGCGAKGAFILILVWAIRMTCFKTQMNSQDVGALLVMDRAVLDADGDEIVTEAEFRASPQTGAMRGIVTERDYLRAVARGAVAADTKGERSQSPRVNSLPSIINHPITTKYSPTNHD